MSRSEVSPSVWNETTSRTRPGPEAGGGAERGPAQERDGDDEDEQDVGVSRRDLDVGRDRDLDERREQEERAGLERVERSLRAGHRDEDDDVGERVEVHERRDLDPLVEVDVLLPDGLDRADRDPPRVERLELARSASLP